MSDIVLKVAGVSKRFGGLQALSDVGISIQKGQVYGLIGPNGAGKTTVFYMITGLVPADAGRITIDGRDVTRLPMYRRARLGIGYLPQEASIFRGLTVEQNIRAVLEVVEPWGLPLVSAPMGQQVTSASRRTFAPGSTR